MLCACRLTVCSELNYLCRTILRTRLNIHLLHRSTWRFSAVEKFFWNFNHFSGQWRCIADDAFAHLFVRSVHLQSQQNRRQQQRQQLHCKKFGESRINDTGNDRAAPMVGTLRRIVEIGVFLSRAHVRLFMGLILRGARLIADIGRISIRVLVTAWCAFQVLYVSEI